MAILNIMTLPPEVPLELVLTVDSAVAAGGPPAGGISHVIIVDEGQVKIFDVWESQEALDTFAQTRLLPEILKATGASDPSQVPPMVSQTFEVSSLMVTPA